MARRRVTYLEVADGRPHQRLVAIELGPPGAGSPSAPPPPPEPPVPHPRVRALAGLLLAGVALLAVVSMVVGPPNATAPQEPAPVVPSFGVAAGPVSIETRHVVDAPWRGVLLHHPVIGAAPDVDTVHVFVLRGDGRRPSGALLVVDANRRANRRGEEPTVRVLGRETGRGLRTLLWDDGAYGLALTTVGLLLPEQEQLAAAVLVPGGPSLLHGRRPALDAVAVGELGLTVATSHSGPATSIGGAIIGQSGAASIDGQLHRRGSGTLLVSVIREQVVPARTVADALGSSAMVDVTELAAVEAAAVLAHPGTPTTFTRVRGWTRLLLDVGDDVTVELASDVLDVDELVDAAASLDLDRLARIVRLP